jgi:Holliday junction resolvase
VKLIKTTCNGIPDLMCLKDGKTIFIEVKTEKGIVSELQKHRHDELRKKGFEVLILTN